MIVIKSLDGHKLLWKDSQANEGPDIGFDVCLVCCLDDKNVRY